MPRGTWLTSAARATLALQTREIVTALRAVTFKGRELLIVGTAVFAGETEYEDAALDGEYRVTAKEGRVLVIDPSQGKVGTGSARLDIGVLHKTVEPVHDVAAVNGLLAVASASQVGSITWPRPSLNLNANANHQVTILRLTLSPLTLTQKHTFSSTFIAQHLHVLPPSPAAPHTGAAAAARLAAAGGDVDMEDMSVGAVPSPVGEVLEERLVVGDGMRSISVLDVDPKTGAIYRETRDMATHSVAGLGGVRDGGQGVIISDVSLRVSPRANGSSARAKSEADTIGPQQPPHFPPVHLSHLSYRHSPARFIWPTRAHRPLPPRLICAPRQRFRRRYSRNHLCHAGRTSGCHWRADRGGGQGDDGFAAEYGQVYPAAGIGVIIIIGYSNGSQYERVEWIWVEYVEKGRE